MTAWMGYATLVGIFLVVAGVLLEHSAPWLAGKRRMIWLAVIAGTLMLTIYALVPGAERNAHPTNTVRAREQFPVAAAPADPRRAVPLASEREPITSVAVGATSEKSFELDVILIIVWLLASAICLVVLVASAWRVSACGAPGARL